jgi:protein O-GlcNAc transferase
MTPPSDLLNLGLQHHRAGHVVQAETLYQRLLEVDPGNADALHLLGVIATHRGQPDVALGLIEHALALRPRDPGFLLNLGVAQHALGRPVNAAASFRKALEHNPRFAEAHNNLANVLHTEGQTDQALDHWRQALELRPDYVEAHQNLAGAYLSRRDFASSLRHAREAVRLTPDSPDAHVLVGKTLTFLDQLSDAEAALRRAIRIAPNHAAAHACLAHTLRRQGRLDASLVEANEALRLQPGSAQVHVEAGVSLGLLSRRVEAEAHFRRALALEPASAEAQNNLGALFLGWRRYGEAAECFRRALAASPQLAETAVNLGRALAHEGDLAAAAECLREATNRIPTDGKLRSALGEILTEAGHLTEAEAVFRDVVANHPDLSAAHSSLLIALNFKPEARQADLLAEHRLWAQRHGRAAAVSVAERDRSPERRLRIGYVSPDLLGHVVAHFLAPILVNHDAREVEVFCYADVLATDGVTEGLRSFAHHWRPIQARSDEDVAALVAADGIDILVDLAGHTGCRLGVFARQPAPVQVTWLGYPNTTGLDAIHYRLTDAVADPDGEPSLHSEELVRLTGGFSAYAPKGDAPEPGPLPANLRGYVTFGSMHKLSKLNDQVLDLWADLLHRIPSARLLVFRHTLRGRTLDYFQERFARRGLSGDRVEFQCEVADGGNYLSVYRKMDILLDTFPWNGHATACEALWMGVPVVTLLSDRHAGRMVASVLNQVGLTEFVAPTPEEYVSKAAALAANLSRLASLRAGLREQVRSSPLMDGRAFTRKLEAAYRAMWQRWLKVDARTMHLAEDDST